MSEEEKKTFVVRDRRRFDAEGNSKDSETEAKEDPKPQAQAPQAPRTEAPRADAPRAGAPRAEGSAGGSAARSRGRAPAIAFTDFILSLGTNAAVLLGGEDAELVPSRADVAQASQYIDIIAMLKGKTTGNLDPEELALVDSVLYDLQMKYLEVARSQGLVS